MKRKYVTGNICYFLLDPSDIYSAHESGSKDALDFRHHNYKEMRKVRKVTG